MKADDQLVYVMIGQPWTLRENNGIAFAGTYVKKVSRGILVTKETKERIAASEAAANAKLIAAAPEMLQALQLARDFVRDQTLTCEDGVFDRLAATKLIDAAIAKALKPI